MQVYKCLTCFLKTHNKQLNQYCLNFIIFLQKKKRFGFESGQVDSQKTRVELRANPVLLVSKILGSGRVFFGSSQKIVTRFTMSSSCPLTSTSMGKITKNIVCIFMKL